MSYIGDFSEDYATLNMKFTTVGSDGASTVLAGTPVISVYKANGITQSTAGITLTVDFDSVVGLNNVLIDLSSDAFYAVGNDYQVVITTGTVGGISVVGYVVAEFSIENRFMRGTDSASTLTKSDVAKSFKDTDVASTNPAAGSLFENVVGSSTVDELQERASIVSAVISKTIAGKTQKYIALYTQDGAAAGTRNFQKELLGALIASHDNTTAATRQYLPILGFYQQDGAGVITEINGIAADLDVDATTDLAGASWTGAIDESTAGAGYTMILPFVDGWTTPTSNNDLRIIYPRAIGMGDTLESGMNPTASIIADAVWDELKAGHVAANSFGKIVQDLETNLAIVDGNVDDIETLLNTVDGKIDIIDTNVDTINTATVAIKAKTDNLPEAIKKNTASAKFPFSLKLASDNVSAATGVSVTAERLIDGGTFVAMANSAVEDSDGMYNIDLAAADTNGTFITYKFSGTGARTRLMSFKTTL